MVVRKQNMDMIPKEQRKIRITKNKADVLIDNNWFEVIRDDETSHEDLTNSLKELVFERTKIKL